MRQFRNSLDKLMQKILPTGSLLRRIFKWTCKKIERNKRELMEEMILKIEMILGMMMEKY